MAAFAREVLIHLLADILDSQDTASARPVVSGQRAARAVAGFDLLAPNERRALLRDPASREAYLTARREHVESYQQRIEDAGIETTVLPLAASGESGELTFRGRDFTVSATLVAEHPDQWVVELSIGQRLKACLTGDAFVRLSDSGGLVWAAGRLSPSGRLTAPWPSKTEMPRERATDYALRIDPY